MSTEVGRRLQRFVGAHLLEAVIPIGQAGNALALEHLEQLLANAPLRHVVQVFLVIEDVGQVEHFERAHAERPELGHRRREHLDAAELQHLHLFTILVQRAIGVHVNLDPALGARFGEFLEFQRALAFGCVLRHHVAELDDDRLLGIRRAYRKRRNQSCDQDFTFQIHGALLTLIERPA